MLQLKFYFYFFTIFSAFYTTGALFAASAQSQLARSHDSRICKDPLIYQPDYFSSKSRSLSPVQHKDISGKLKSLQDAYQNLFFAVRSEHAGDILKSKRIKPLLRQDLQLWAQLQCSNLEKGDENLIKDRKWLRLLRSGENSLAGALLTSVDEQIKSHMNIIYQSWCSEGSVHFNKVSFLNSAAKLLNRQAIFLLPISLEKKIVLEIIHSSFREASWLIQVDSKSSELFHHQMLQLKPRPQVSAMLPASVFVSIQEGPNEDEEAGSRRSSSVSPVHEAWINEFFEEGDQSIASIEGVSLGCSAE